MAIDEAISIFVRKGAVLPTFRLYGWSKKGITIGEFQQEKEINYEYAMKQNIPIVRRPTGGKGILHIDDITYSFSARKEDRFRGNLFQTYEIISKVFFKAFKLTGIPVEIKREKRVVNKSALCFALSSFGEICYKGIKIIGSAQKRWVDGFLQQGTIPLTTNREMLSKLFLCSTEDVSKVYGLKEIFENFEINQFQENIILALKEESFQPQVGFLLDEEIELAEELLHQKYSFDSTLYPYECNRKEKLPQPQDLCKYGRIE